jgi:hypothetical protein
MSESLSTPSGWLKKMPFVSLTSTQVSVLAFILAMGLGMLCFLAHPPYSGDDCYIIYHYAYNLYAHKQFVFNLGERILGTTTPLYTLILAGLQIFWDKLPQMSHLISFLSASLAGFLIFLVFRTRNPILGLFYIVCFPFILLDIGLETNFLIFLLALSLYLFDRERYLICAVIFALCFLTRQDSAIFIACMILIYGLKKGKIPQREFIVFIMIIAPWFIFSYLYFGSIFPATLQAKTGHATFLQYFFDGFFYLATYCDRYNFYLLSFFSKKITYLLSPGPSYSKYIFKAGLVILYLPVVLLGLWHGIRNRKKDNFVTLIFYIYPIPMILALSAIGPPPEHKWHLTSAVNFALIGQLNLLTVGASSVIKRWWSSSLRLRALSTFSAVMMFLYLFHFGSVNITRFYKSAEGADESFWFGARFHNYHEIALFLRDHVPEKEKVFALEVGTLAYYSKKRMIDGAGLMSPGYDQYHKRGCWLLGIEKEFPDYIVAHEVVIPHYEPVFSFENSFGKKIVYRKSKNLPENEYPFAELKKNCMKEDNRVKGVVRRSGEGKSGRVYELISGMIDALLNKYQR